ncbi:MAG: dephospho-CoA kinase [Oceanicoccus sp.]|jgi:dephospho-CoA kinase
MFVVGLTGGIGSGKTAATDYFQSLGIAIVDADIASRTVVEQGKPALAAISAHFGDDVLQIDGTLDRAALRKCIFSDATEKQWLEKLLHPLIAEEIHQGLQTADSLYAIFVSPLLIESRQMDLCDQILVIDVPEEIQLQRTTQRDNNDSEQVKRIIASQATRQQRIEKATDIVENIGTLADLHIQLNKLHQKYSALAENEGDKS